MEAKSLTKFIRISPRKMRLSVDLIRGRGVNEALNTLKFTTKGSAKVVEKALRSAIANADQKIEGLDVDNLYVKEARVDQGPTLKRWRARPMGRAVRILKRTSHLEITLEERA